MTPEERANAIEALKEIILQTGGDPEYAGEVAEYMIDKAATQVAEGKIPGKAGSGFDYSPPPGMAP